MQSFKIAVHQNRIKNNQVTALHIMVGILLLLLGLVTYLVPNQMKTEKFQFLNKIGILYALLGVGIMCITVFFNKRVIQTSKNEILRIVEMIALGTIHIYSLIQEWYLPAAYTFAAFIAIIFAYLWETKAKKDLIIELNDKGVWIPKLFFKKQIFWQDVKHILFNHKVLSIDCKDNKLYQYKLIGIKDQLQDTTESYIKEQIKAHEHLYDKDW